MYPQCGQIFASREGRDNHHRKIHLEGETLDCRFWTFKVSTLGKRDMLFHLIRFHNQRQLVIYPTRLAMALSEKSTVLQSQELSEPSDSERQVTSSSNHELISTAHERQEIPQFLYMSSKWTESVSERNQLLGVLSSFKSFDVSDPPRFSSIDLLLVRKSRPECNMRRPRLFKKGQPIEVVGDNATSMPV